MNIFKRFGKIFNKSPTHTTNTVKLVQTQGNGIYSWDGTLYQSDIMRACLRPYASAIGKLQPKHILESGDDIIVNGEPYIKTLLEEPNPLMSFQDMLEKMALQFALNSNAFVLIYRDNLGMPYELYPIDALSVEAIYKDDALYLKFCLKNNSQLIAPYTDIIHLRNDFYNNDVFGSVPAAAITEMMDIISTTDQGLTNAIKNSGVVQWLIRYNTILKDEDIKKNVKNFVNNYLSVNNESMGVVASDAKGEIQRVEPKDYVPNAEITARSTERIYNFCNTNERIIQSLATEDEWNSYYEQKIAPFALKCKNEFTRKLFTRKEKDAGNKIFFESSSLSCASLQTKLALVAMVDRGSLLPDEWRATMNMSKIPGGNVPIRRLDTDIVTEEKNNKKEDEA